MWYLLMIIIFGNLITMTFKSSRSVLGILAPVIVMSLSSSVVLLASYSKIAIIIALYINLSLFLFSVYVIVRVLRIKAKEPIDDIEYWEGYDNDEIPVRSRVFSTQITKMFVWQRDRGRCVLCNSNQNLEFNYIIPISKGGSNTDENIQLLCERCNCSK